MNKEEAIEILSEMRSEYNLFGDEEEATRYHVLSWAIKEMNGESVKHGHWIRESQTRFEKIFFSSRVFKCSVCGNYLDFDDVNVGRGSANYCPNCGAKMGGEDEIS